MAAPWGTDSPISVADVTGVTQQQRWAHEMGMQIVKNPGTTVNAIGGGVQPVVGMPGMVGVAGSPMTTINTKNTDATSMPELLDVDSRIEQRLQQLLGELTNPEADAMASVRALSVLIKERDMTAAAFKG